MPFPLPNEGGSGLRPLEEILFVDLCVGAHLLHLYATYFVVQASRSLVSQSVFIVQATKDRT
jgi:hypothetical protein